MHATLSETCILNVYERINHQNAKNHGIEHIWEYKNITKKKSVVSVFELNYQNAKEHAKHPL